MKENSDNRTVTVELLQAIINYLQQRPHHEVNNLINEIVKQSKDK